MGIISNNVIKEDNKCCGKGCAKHGRLHLKINYIKFQSFANLGLAFDADTIRETIDQFGRISND